MTTKLDSERLDRIESLVREIRDLLLYERQGQAVEIDKFIEQWRLSKIEPREVPIAD